MKKNFALLLAVFAGAPAQADAPLNPPVGTATETTRRANASVAAALPLDDKRDFRDAARGLLAQIEADAIRNEDGEVVWDIAAENLLAGNHMSRRVTLMFGGMLERSPLGHVSSGLGPALANGAPGLIPPTEELDGRDSQRSIDGVRFQFIDAAGTEAPAEFMFYLPGFRALCTAEVASGTLHNALTLRGAKARDLLRWSEVIDHLLVSYAGRSDVVFASHHWPTWGRDEVRGFLTAQRDIYRYIHDQTLRRANAGATIVEVAEQIGAPAFASEEFSVRDYYGTLNHNAKAVYQYYFGWWDGVPAHFYQHPPEARAARFVALLGGADNAVDQGRKAFGDGDYRWAAEILSHAVFADPANEPARAWLAASYEQLGFEGDAGSVRAWLGALDRPAHWFNVVVP